MDFVRGTIEDMLDFFCSLFRTSHCLHFIRYVIWETLEDSSPSIVIEIMYNTLMNNIKGNKYICFIIKNYNTVKSIS